MVLKKGAAVPIRVDDPGQLLSQHEGKTAGAHLLIGVSTGSGLFYPALEVSKDTAGRNRQVVIPFDVPIKIVVNSAFFQLEDGLGRPLPQASSTIVPLTISPGQQAQAVRFIVTGTGR